MGEMIELKVPRMRENFYPGILGLLKDQQQEAHNLAFELYKPGLTTELVGSVFDQLYNKYHGKPHV